MNEYWFQTRLAEIRTVHRQGVEEAPEVPPHEALANVGKGRNSDGCATLNTLDAGSFLIYVGNFLILV